MAAYAILLAITRSSPLVRHDRIEIGRHEETSLRLRLFSLGIITTSAVLKTLGWWPSYRQALYSIVSGPAMCGQAAYSILVVIPSEPGVVFPV